MNDCASGTAELLGRLLAAGRLFALVWPLAFIFGGPALAQAPGRPPAALKVVVTSKPVHALVAGVMQGIAVPDLLVDGTASPHTYAMKPSDAQKVHQADVVFRVSEALEPFTAKLMQALPASVRRVTLAEAPGVQRLPRRAGGAFDERGGDHAGHAHGPTGVEPGDGYDPHVWLDPANARAMTAAIAAVLAERMPSAGDRFNTNAKRIDARLGQLSAEIARDLAPVAKRPFIVFHDATQYFEQRFGLAAAGSITVSPETQPSARQLSNLRAKVGALTAVCVFMEPHLPQRLAASVTEGTSARLALLDPEGTTLPAGPDLYEQLLRKLAGDVKTCLMPPD